MLELIVSNKSSDILNMLKKEEDIDRMVCNVVNEITEFLEQKKWFSQKKIEAIHEDIIDIALKILENNWTEFQVKQSIYKDYFWISEVDNTKTLH